MVLKIFFLFREVKYLLLTLMTFLLLYFFTMDLVLYQTLQNTTLIEEAKMIIPKVHSPFHPLSVKLLTLDHFSHYVIKPTAELFNYVTDFSSTFCFITPNMISVSHALVGFAVVKFVSSENLRSRRFAAFLYELRTWLDGLDGALYRNRHGETIYTTHGVNIVNVDSICDAIGGGAICLGVFLYLNKRYKKSDILPSSHKHGKQEGDSTNISSPTTREIAVTMTLFGVLVATAGRSWEYQVSRAEILFEIPMTDSKAKSVQTIALHACATWWVFWFWRLIGQTFFHYLVIAIVLDKIWVFVSRAWYLGGLAVMLLNIASYLHFTNVEILLNVSHA